MKKNMPLPLVQELLDAYCPHGIANLTMEGPKNTVASFRAKTHQRKAKRRSVTACLEYIPEPRFAEDPNAPPTISDNVLDKFYVSLELSNESNQGAWRMSAVTHYLPIRALDGLFEIRNAICEEQLFEYYMRYREKTDRHYSGTAMPADLWALHRQDFFDNHGTHPLFYHNYFESFWEGKKEKEYSQLSVTFDNKTKAGTDTNAPLQFGCMRMPKCPKLIDEDEELYEVCWDSDLLTITAVRCDSQQFVMLVDKIHRALCHWLETANGGMHGDYVAENDSQSIISEVPKSHFDTLECSLGEAAILELIERNPAIKQQELAAATDKSLITVKRLMKSLQDKNYIRRENGKRYGKWEILV